MPRTNHIEGEALRTSDAPVDPPTELLDHARSVSLEGWQSLGPEQRRFTRTVLFDIERGRGALARTLGGALTRFPGPNEEALDRFVRRVAAYEEAQTRMLRALRERTEELDGASPDSYRLEPVTRYFEDLARPLFRTDAPPEHSPAGRAALTLFGVYRVAIGVGVGTGLKALGIILRRNKVLEDLADLLDRLCRSDREMVRAIGERLERTRSLAPQLDDLVQDRVDGSIVSTVELIRDVQSEFELITIGVVPDEFVAEALDRFFDITGATR